MTDEPMTEGAATDNTTLGADAQQLAVASYNQNFDTFRALNALMWQIPLIAMTLTGGLWFGVSKVKEMPLFQAGLLLLALLGNIGLVIVLERLRHIIGCYLEWLRVASPRGHVSVNGRGILTGDRTVKTVFQAMLAVAAGISLALLVATVVAWVRLSA